MEYHKRWLNKSYFCLWFLHLEVMKLVCLMHIELLFPVVSVGVFDKAVYIKTGFSLTPFWSLKLFSTAKEPFNKDFSFFSFLRNTWIWIATYYATCYVLTTGPKANQNLSFTWCSDVRVTANRQIIFHTFLEKSRGLHTRLTTVNHRRPFSDFSWGEGGSAHRLSNVPRSGYITTRDQSMVKSGVTGKTGRKNTSTFLFRE